MDMTNIDAIIDRYNKAPSALLAIMQDVQEEERYLPKEAMNRIASRMITSDPSPSYFCGGPPLRDKIGFISKKLSCESH